MAVFCTLLPFEVLNNFWNNSDKDYNDANDESKVGFLCFQGTGTLGGVSGSHYLCPPLHLNHALYWAENNNENNGNYYNNYDDDDWAFVPMQVGAAIGIVAAACGLVACTVLLTGICFPLAPRKIRNIVILQGVAGVCSLLTLVAAASDRCKAAGFPKDSCYDEDIHLDTGAFCMIVAFLIYIPAAYTTYLLYRQTVQEQQE